MTLIKYTIETVLVLLAIELVIGQYITSPQSIGRKQNEPFTYLQPPPPVPVLNYNYQNYNNLVWKQHQQRRPQPQQEQQQPQYTANNFTSAKNDVSFVQKVVRWFGFGGNNSLPKSKLKDSPQKYQQHQQPMHQPKFHLSQNVQYRGNNYNTPEIQSILPAAALSEWSSTPSKNINGELITTKGTGKCLPCNQIPWIPIFPFYQTPILINKHNVGGGDPRNQLTTPKLTTDIPDDVETIPSIVTSSPKPSTTVSGLTTTSTTQLPYDTEKLISLSTVQPNFYSHHQSFIHGLAPIPVPNLSATPIPPLYDAKSFLYNPYGSNFLKPFSKSESKSQHQKYKIEAVSDVIVGSTKSSVVAPPIQTASNIITTEPPKFSKISDNFSSHLYKDLEITSDTDIEVIKSIPLAHFSTTVLQYPNSNNHIVHQQQSYGTNLGNIKHDIKVLNTLINESIVNEPISIADSNPAATNNQNFTVGSEIQFVRPETTTRDYLYDEEFSETKQPIRVENTAGIPDQIIYGKPNGIENTVSVLNAFATDPQENYQSTNRFSKSSSFNSIPPFEEYQPTKWTTTSPIQTTLYDEAKKKSKQIQIIIPYIVDRQKPGPYVTSNYDNWNVQNSYQNDDYAHGESKILYQTNKPVVEKNNPKFLTKILASNLRELLRKEIPKSTQNLLSDQPAKRPFFIDQAKLQMNIDDWTQQEFSTSNMEQKASTISLLVSSKIIPNEYLTTTPSSIETTTVWLESDEMSFEDDYKDQFGYENDKSHLIVSDSTEETRSFDNSLWNKLGVTISPITHEKVHVVTPLKLNAVVNSGDPKNSADKLIESNYKYENLFKSPRFVVRPTPGSPTKGLNQLKSTLAYSINNLETTSASVNNGGHLPLLKPKLFGYMNYFSPLSELIEKEDGELSEKQRIQIVTPLSFIRRNNLDSGDENVSN